MKKNFRPFHEARKSVHSLKLKRNQEWRDYCKSGNKPDDIPSNPDKAYKDQGWISFGDWLGTGNISNVTKAKRLRPFKEARKFSRSLGLNDIHQWNEFCKSGKVPSDIPSYPNNAYKTKGWISVGDWLGTGSIANTKREFRTFEDARKYVHSLKLKRHEDWIAFTKSKKMPKDIPTHPDRTYPKNWKGYGDWLGTGRIATQHRKYRKFEDSKDFVRKLNLKNLREWQQFSNSDKRPSDIPSMPPNTYKKEWKNWGDWLGTDTSSNIIKSKNWLPWEKAKIQYQKIAKDNKFKTKNDWIKYITTQKLPKGLPRYPAEVYTEARTLKNLRE